MRLLVGYDGSNAANDALKLAITHARAFEAGVLIVTSRSSGDADEVVQVRKAEKDLEAAKQLVDEAGIECETHLLIRGLSPGEDIVSYARERGVDGIIIGVKRRSKVGKVLFGSNAQYIILKAHCPVTSIR
jgi:nucleotide-binding universal stress UspA family protein